jgi:transposase
MRELSVAEQRYQAVLAVIKVGRTVTETAAAIGVSRQTLHAWLGKYEAGGLDGLVDGSHRPAAHPAQMSGRVEVAVLEARRSHPSWGPMASLADPGLVATCRCAALDEDTWTRYRSAELFVLEDFTQPENRAALLQNRTRPFYQAVFAREPELAALYST